MNEEGFQANDEPEIKLETPDVEAAEAEKPVTEAKQEISKDAEAPIEPVKPKRRLRRFLFWTLCVIGLFALGLVATWFFQVGPLTIELEKARIEIESLESELSESHRQLLIVLFDVTSAQLALAHGDTVSAKAALIGTRASLLEFEKMLSAEDADTVGDLIKRLELVPGEIDTNEAAASLDLEILANSLLSLERSLFR